MGECGLAGEGIDVDTSHEQGALAAAAQYPAMGPRTVGRCVRFSLC